jgi:hypothetical protein
MVQLILASKNRPDFSVMIHRSDRFGHGLAINSDSSIYFESWPFHLIDENPVALTENPFFSRNSATCNCSG